ncbi:RICIN domain-containing protein [Nonomuraea sp. NBC_01738]|uniref:RICIN domain-containing protein n=1 Tax=Nonomuraea sp. NBC_01738 TaxID=2976003 RepID=UPI002E13A1FA|nr:RICIN domain-containing protein [Nonomuraea sp. NBC_01738]
MRLSHAVIAAVTLLPLLAQPALGEQDAGGAVTVVNQKTGRCLAVAKGTTKKGVKAIQWSCYRGDAPEQVWLLNKV